MARAQIRISRERVCDFSYPSRRLIYVSRNLRYRYPETRHLDRVSEFYIRLCAHTQQERERERALNSWANIYASVSFVACKLAGSNITLLSTVAFVYILASPLPPYAKEYRRRFRKRIDKLSDAVETGG